MNFEKQLLACPVAHWSVQQIVVFDWYDGPREGVCALEMPVCEFFFELIAERYNPEGCDDRLFRLQELSQGTVAIIASYFALQESAGNIEIDQLLKATRQTNIFVWTQNMKTFLGCWLIDDLPPNQQDWFAYLGI